MGRIANFASGPIPKVRERETIDAEIRNPEYLAFIRRQPCIILGTTAETVAHHVRVGLNRGAKKPGDDRCVPLADSLHNIKPGSLHIVGEAQFWNRYAIDPFPLARDLYALFTTHGPAIAAAHELIRMHRDCGQIRKRVGIKVFDEKLAFTAIQEG